jgi:hypothetical protein
LQSVGVKRIKIKDTERVANTFALESLAEKTFQQFLAVLANRRPFVIVNHKSVWHFDATLIFLLHPQRTSAPRLGTVVARVLRIGHRRQDGLMKKRKYEEHNNIIITIPLKAANIVMQNPL